MNCTPASVARGLDVEPFNGIGDENLHESLGKASELQMACSQPIDWQHGLCTIILLFLTTILSAKHVFGLPLLWL